MSTTVLTRKIAELVETNPLLADYTYPDVVAQLYGDFPRSIAAQFARKGVLSERQIEAACRVIVRGVERANERAATAPVAPVTGNDPAADLFAPTDVPTGRYAVRVNASDEHYAFYRVWEGDRATLVFLQLSDDEQRLSRPAAVSILAKIAAVGALEASKAYGSEIGVCGVCNRTLTNPESIGNGIGPICAKRF